MDETFQFSDLVVEPPLELVHDGQGKKLRISKTDIPYAKLTSRSNTAYSWTEQDYDANGVGSNSAQPNTGNATLLPAYELSGSTTVPANNSVVVPLWLGPTGDYYLFSAPGSGSGGVPHTITVVTGVTCNGDGTITVTTSTIIYLGPS